jgi:hypothetical protein
VGYLSETLHGGFNSEYLANALLAFEYEWQLNTWGTNTGEGWSPTGDLFDILMTVKTKWGYIL